VSLLNFYFERVVVAAVVSSATFDY